MILDNYQPFPKENIANYSQKTSVQIIGDSYK